MTNPMDPSVNPAADPAWVADRDAAGKMTATEADAYYSALESQRPDPTKTGPCALQLSFACTGAGYERLDPRDMLAPETSFRTPVIMCVECYELAADHYLKELHS